MRFVTQFCQRIPRGDINFMRIRALSVTPTDISRFGRRVEDLRHSSPFKGFFGFAKSTEKSPKCE